MKFGWKYFKPILKMDLQGRLVAGFVIATCLTGFVATFINIWSIDHNTTEEVQTRVRQDINTAKMIFDNTLSQVSALVQYAVEGQDLKEFIYYQNMTKAENCRVLIRHRQDLNQPEDHLLLDMLTVTDHDGYVLYRVANPQFRGDNLSQDPVVRACLQKKAPVSSTELMNFEALTRENPELGRRATINIIKTPRAADIDQKQLSVGMVMRSACPILDENKNVIGVLVGGILLNNDNSIVDKVKETVYRGETYKGRAMGVATIFQGGIRIATNVMTKENQRAIGTIISSEVYNRVIAQGKDWIGKTFAVNDWYFTTYIPIFNMDRKLIGVLVTGILDSKYRDIKWEAIWTNVGITALGMVIAFLIALRMGNTIVTRISMLKEASEAIAAGNLDYTVSPDKMSGFNMLDKAFNNMAKSLKDRDDRLQQMHQHIARTDRLTALGGIAAGVAHEINNPLGGILLYSNLVLEDIAENSPARENIKKIIYQTDRCKKIVQNLLDFARAPTGDMVNLQINDVIRTSLNLVEDQAMFHGVEVEMQLAENLPDVIGDPSRLEEVFLNLFINAADAMNGKGKLAISSMLGNNNVIRIAVSDTGKGIEREHLPHIFEPFFTTKDPGKGTGLGLSIAYGVINKHNGMLDAESAPGKGTTFIITLPGVDLMAYDEEKRAQRESAGAPSE